MKPKVVVLLVLPLAALAARCNPCATTAPESAAYQAANCGPGPTYCDKNPQDQNCIVAQTPTLNFPGVLLDAGQLDAGDEPDDDGGTADAADDGGTDEDGGDP